MSFRNKGLGWSQALGVAIASTVSFYANSSVAQITPDQTLPTNSNVTLEDNIRTITGGTQAGENLFHSFREFSVPTGSEAFFNNGADIRNIISRVTGGSISNIDGLIRANGANLFLMNPNGIVFGPNARLGVGGSFLATSANSMKFDNGSEFSAVNPQSPPLLTINVPLGLQLGTNSGSIRVEGNGEGRRTPDSPIIDTQDALRVGSDKTLALVGGDIELEGATLKTAGGRIELGSVAGNGFVGLTPDNKGFALDYGGVENFGDIRLSQQANVDASGAGAGDVKVQSRRLSLTDGSRIETSTLGASEGGNLVVNATESVETMGRFGGLRASVYRDATGNGGDLNIRTGQLVVGDGAQVSTSTFGAGKGGNLAVTADDSIQVIGRSAGGESSSGLFARTNRGATGNAGDLTIKTGELVVRDGAQVSANTNGAGIGGNLTVTASESIQLIGIGKSAGGSNVVSGLFAQTLSRATGAGDGGDLNIEAGELVAQDGARVGTSTFGAGNAGNLKVNSAQKVKLSGTSSDGESRSGLLAVAFSRATGEAGNITIETGDLLVENGAEVSAKTFSPGKGGDLTVNATNKVELVGRSPIKNQDTSGLFTETGSAGKAGNLNIKTGELVVRDGAEVSAITFGAGDAGDLTIKTGELLVRDGARVDASTSGAGKGGNLTVTADDSIQVIGRSAGGENSSGLFARARRGETGNAGNLTIQTDQLVVRDGAQVSTSTSGAGKGGNLTVTARESIQLIGRSADDRVSSGLFARTGQGETGDAGNLTIKTSDLVVQDGAQVSANTNGAGRGGNLTIIAGESIKLIGIGKSAGGSNVPSGLFAQTLSRATGAGDGGDLNIEAGELVAQDGARVGTSTFGAGNAGNLKVNSAQKVKLSGTSSDGESRSGLLAVAFSRATGEAGNITIETGDLLVENGAEVSAKTFSPGNGGNLTVNATNKVELVGRSPIKNQDTSGLFTETGNDQIRNARNGGELGNAGNLTINTQELLISDGANVNANTFGAGNAGNLTVNASENIQIIGRSSRLSARAGLGATGDAGDLTIKTGELVVRDGAFVDVGTFGAGKGGNLTVEASESIKIIGNFPTGLFTQANPQATGDAGDLQIDTNFLLVKGRGGIFVRNLGQGNAGSLNIDANSIRLDNNARISADTRSPNNDPNNPQANINIRSQDLILRRGSRIRANATGENVTGGNITIDTGVLAGFENSDITANSGQGRGGNVVINAEGVFGIQFRDELSPLSDITATGENNQLSGNVEIDTTESDPTRGLAQVPPNTVDPSDQIYDPCTPGNPGFGSSFVSVGRGGLPMNPTEPLQDTSTISTWVRLKPQPASRTNRKVTNRKTTNRKTSSQPTTTAKTPKVEKPTEAEKPIEIVEANGWIVNENGNIEFVAQANHTNPTSPWQNPPSCSASQ